jgi:predicted transcriptional regulator
MSRTFTSFVKSSVIAQCDGRAIARSVAALVIGLSCFAAQANSLSAGLGVSATVIHRVVAQTPVGAISTICNDSACPAPRVSLDDVDLKTGTRVIQVIY